MRRALVGANLSDLLSATDLAEPEEWVERLLDGLATRSASVLLVLDDAHHLAGSGTAALVVRIARALPPQHRLLIAARTLGRAFEPIWRLPDAVRLDTRALAFTHEEAAELIRLRLSYVPAEHEVRALLDTTQGWATALVLAATRLALAEGSAADDGAAEVSADPDLIGSPLRAILQGLAAADQRALLQLAQLPFVSPELCDLVSRGEGTFDRLVAAGVPLARTDAGWWEMPGPVAEYLAAQGSLEVPTAKQAAEVYRRNGELLAAIRVLIAAGAHSEAAGILEAVPVSAVEQLGAPVVRGLVDSLPPRAVTAHPRVLLHLARVAETAHQAGLRAEALARASELVASTDPRLRREVDAELARDLIWDERTRPEASALAEAVIAAAGEDELIARARAFDVLGRLASWFSTSGPQPAAEHLLEDAARLAQRLGQHTWAAQALVPLAMGFYCALGRFERALDVLDDALAELPFRNRYRALVQTFRADTLVEVGRFAEAESSITEMREIGRACREEWVLAYASWSEAGLASYQGDRQRTVRAVLDVERHLDDWFEQASGVEFLAQASDFLSRAGEHEMALKYLARARDRMAGCERPVRFHGAATLARSGDADEAERALGEVLGAAALDPHERWPLLLLRAHVALRRGASDAGELAAQAFEACQELGHPEGPLIRERAISRPLLMLAAQAGSHPAAALLRDGGALWIRVLGGFALARAGEPVELPAGRPGKAVRVVAAAGGRLHAEELIEILWPHGDPAAARNRLRNLLSRLRTAAGELLVRDGEMIVLAGDAETDARRFEEQAVAALLASEARDQRRAVALGRSALASYGGELLPDDRYERWAVEPRERLRARFIDVLDLLADAAAQLGHADEAARLLRLALDAQRYDE
ncbi:MAG TPA: BTAD domain-containing putative transcriptional regulator, partial [Solirubrobacteraceae bacterium]|nr:BTAD domain-containing putative transcriptional regulator [Solirubrobacteraceae bacterium]